MGYDDEAAILNALDITSGVVKSAVKRLKLPVKEVPNYVRELSEIERINLAFPNVQYRPKMTGKSNILTNVMISNLIS